MVDDRTKKKAEITASVTDATADALVVQYTHSTDQNANGTWVYDLDWNTVEENGWKVSPNAGDGIRRPLAPNESWTMNAQASWEHVPPFKHTGEGHVEVKEKVRTKVGVFDTYRIKIVERGPLRIRRLWNEW